MNCGLTHVSWLREVDTRSCHKLCLVVDSCTTRWGKLVDAAEIVRTLGDRGEPLIITQNGEAKVVMQDIDSYERMQETVALLKMLALGDRQVEAGRVQPVAAVARLRERQRTR